MNKNFNMKKLILTLSLVVLVSFSLAGITLFFTKGSPTGKDATNPNIQNQEGGSSEGSFKKEINEEKSFAIDGLKRIDIESISNDINVIESPEGTALRAHLHGTISASSENFIPYLDTSTNGDRIKISIKRKSNNVVGFLRDNTTLDIYLPKEYVQAISAKNISGDTKIDRIQSTDFRFSSVSGSLQIESLNGDKVDLNSTSGDIAIANLDVKTLKHQAISGQIAIENCKIEESTLKTTSGNIRLENSQGNMDIESISGELFVVYKRFNNEMKARTTSGNVHLKLPVMSSFAIETDTVSGNFISDFPITLTGNVNKKSISGRVGSSDNKISVRTISGDIILNPIK